MSCTLDDSHAIWLTGGVPRAGGTYSYGICPDQLGYSSPHATRIRGFLPGWGVRVPRPGVFDGPVQGRVIGLYFAVSGPLAGLSDGSRPQSFSTASSALCNSISARHSRPVTEGA